MAETQRGSSSGVHIASTTSMNAGVESIFNTSWDPLSQNGELKSSAMGSHSNNSHILQYPLDPGLLELSPKLSSFGSGSFTAMVNSFELPEYDQITNASCPDYLPNNSRGVNDHGAMFHGGSGLSPDAANKRRRVHDNSQIQTGEMEHQETNEKEQDSKKQKIEKNPGPNSRGKSNGKQTKDGSENEQSSKEDYIHVRARRGQATNSHSLAERVRREKISQRMKYLQDLVPGCDKITGKALMLDEIINYVQSLQRQVEFLSMKLSTVNPDLNIDIERIMSKDSLGSQVGGPTLLGFGSGNSSHCMPHLTSPGAIQTIHCTDARLHPIQQLHPTWDDELHNIMQMGLMPNQAMDTIGANGKVGTT